MKYEKISICLFFDGSCFIEYWNIVKLKLSFHSYLILKEKMYENFIGRKYFSANMFS